MTGRAPSRIPTIGIVGGIGAGKSTVADAFASEGCLVCDADQLAHESMDDPDVRRQIVEVFSDQVLNPDGSVNRGNLASLVFEDPARRRLLELIIHPRVEARRQEMFDRAPEGTRAFVIDAPLLMETGLDGVCDRIVYVDASEEIRTQRVIEARGWDHEELVRRQKTQIPLDQKRQLAHDVICNEGEAALLHIEVRRVLEHLGQE